MSLGDKNIKAIPHTYPANAKTTLVILFNPII